MGLHIPEYCIIVFIILAILIYSVGRWGMDGWKYSERKIRINNNYERIIFIDIF